MKRANKLAGLERPPGVVYRRMDKGSARSARGFILHSEGVPLARLAEKYGTPLYVYSATASRERVAAFKNAFRSVQHTLCYSVKANSNLSILRMLAREGCGFDVVSAGELERVMTADRTAARRTVFSGV